MNAKKINATLSSKLAKMRRVEQIRLESNVNRCVDIEDANICLQSEFFSPMQTRFQRKISNKPVKIRELTNLKRLKVEKKDVDIKEPKTNEKNLIEKQTIPQNVVDALWEPKHWQTVLENIRKMRSTIDAPVDTMGCSSCKDESANSKTQRFHILVSLMLSSQTKDEVTHAAMERLKTYTLTPETIINMKSEKLAEIIRPVSYYNVKAKHLQLTSNILVDKYNSDIPRSITELIKLPGVGPKMAHLCMAEGWNEITGIGVDVHVHRISNRLGWLPKTTKEPEHTRVLLESWLPRSLWREINLLLVGFGQTICTPTYPKCGTCLNCNICPSAVKPDNMKNAKCIPKRRKLAL